MSNESKETNTPSGVLFKLMTWVLLLSIGITFISIYRYNSIKVTQETIKSKIDFRFKSYDFVYFFNNHKVIPNKDRTKGYICVDTSNKEEFYTGSRKPTPFYLFMDNLSCDKEEPNKKAFSKLLMQS
jgi:hypothetical protein